MNTLIINIETFNKMLSGLIESGVTFEAIQKNENIEVTFTGGY